MRKKKEKAEPAKVGKAEVRALVGIMNKFSYYKQHEGEKNKHGLRRNSLVQTGRMEMFTVSKIVLKQMARCDPMVLQKRARYFSAPAAFQNVRQRYLYLL